MFSLGWPETGGCEVTVELPFRRAEQFQEALVCALIVDDEPLARRGVALRLRNFRDVEIIGECADGPPAVETILELSPDIVFLDVQMPGVDGFDVLRALPRENLPGVIFLTAYETRPLVALGSSLIRC
jgi:two-component system LytT family response regulator